MKNNWQFLDGQNSHSQTTITLKVRSPSWGSTKNSSEMSYHCDIISHLSVLIGSTLALLCLSLIWVWLLRTHPTYLASTKQGSSDTFLWEEKTRGYFRPAWPRGSTQLPDLIHKLLIYRNFWIWFAAKGSVLSLGSESFILFLNISALPEKYRTYFSIANWK